MIAREYNVALGTVRAFRHTSQLMHDTDVLYYAERKFHSILPWRAPMVWWRRLMTDIDRKHRKEQLQEQLQELTEAAMRISSQSRGPISDLEQSVFEEIADIEEELERLDNDLVEKG